MKIKADFYRQRWECGDGCCSDSWHSVYISKEGSNDEIERENVLGIYNEEEAEAYARDEIESIYEIGRDDYELELDY